MTAAHIRPATPEDWSQITELLASYDLPPDGAQEHLHQFVVAEDGDGQIVGAAGLEVYGDAGLLRSVAVRERQRGLGARLVQAALDQANAQGIRQVALLTTTAADYFPRFGFRRVARADLPAALHASQEFQGACPDTAVAMVMAISGQPD